MRRVALAWMLLSTTTIADGPPDGAGISVGEERGIHRMDVVLSGRIVSYAAPREPGRGRSLFFLVAPVEPEPDDDRGAAGDGRGQLPTDSSGEDDRPPPCPEDPVDGPTTSLVRLDRDRRELQIVREGLPADATRLDAFDMDGDGADELVLARDGELLLVDAAGTRPLWSDPRLSWSGVHPRATEQPALAGYPWIPVASLGSLQVVGPDPDGRAWVVLGAFDLPREARIGSGGAEVTSPVPELVGVRIDGTLVLATPPEPAGDRRLRTRVLSLGPSGETAVTEAWARLPGPEEMQEHSFALLDDQPAMFVTTRPADRLALLGEKRIRAYRLEADRSRFGVEPLLSAESNVNLWQDARPMLRDVNGDGAADLILGYWKGILEGRITLDTYLREPGGGFAASARTTAFDVEDADRSFFKYGTDLDGDGLADLLVRTGYYMLLYPGLPAEKKKLVAGRPRVIPEGSLETPPDRRQGSDARSWWEMPFRERPRLLDLDADGTSEILLLASGGRTKPGRLRILRVGPETGGGR